MSLYHQLWDWPSTETLTKGHEYVSVAQNIGAPTLREREYITAASAFFQARAALTPLERVAAYSRAMHRLHLNFPGDSDATAFYALSLLALPVHGSAQRVNRLKAVRILQQLFAAAPNHPGAAHYLIHATDTPDLAPLGLVAARRYAKIAPDSAHALHMPSHIFLRLGLWSEAIDSNLASAAAALHATQNHLDNEVSYQLHAMYFLDYAYLQDGQMAKADGLVSEVKDIPGLTPQDVINTQAYFLLKNALELHHWSDAAGLAVPTDSQAMTYWGRALGAAHIGDTAAARENLNLLHKFVDEARVQDMQTKSGTASGETVEELEVQSWIDFSENHAPQAITLMNSAAHEDERNGDVSLAIPVREMLGDLLFQMKEPRRALKQYKKALMESPNRFDSLYGAARSAQLSDELATAMQYYRKLVSICASNADRPELRTAENFLRAHARASPQ